MAKLKIRDLPKAEKIGKDEMKKVRGGALDCFLKIDGVPGESPDSRLTEEVSLNKAIDKASPALL